MPSFPDSVFAPANRSNGQTIDASHMNGVQDEIVAIEGGIINGTARVNSSVLNVTAGSTFAVRPVEPPPHCVRLELTAAVEVAGNSTEAVSWTDQIVAVNSSIHSTATNSSRVTPQSTGVYLFDLYLDYRASASTAASAWIKDSSGGTINRVRARGEYRGVRAWGIKRYDVLGGWAKAVLFSNSTNSASTESVFTMTKL